MPKQRVTDRVKDLAERIRLRAYEIWEREGRPYGRDQEHWAQAEREIGDEPAAAAKTGPRKPRTKKSR